MKKGKNLLTFTFLVGKEFTRDRCLLRASSLSYSTLLAIVPLSGLIFALFTAFGAFEPVKIHIQNFIVQMLIPTMHDEFLRYLNTFIANSKALGIAGLLIFAFTSILLLDSISETFNAVWGSSNRRNFIAKFTSYSSVIVFGTLFIGASFAITSPLHAALLKFPKGLFIVGWFIQLLPSLFIFITFLLMISAIPAGKVNMKSALTGAFCGTVLWDLSRWIFVNGTNYVMKMSIIYGSLAAIPIFLLWLYIIWIIMLGSLEITYVHQYVKRGSLKAAEVRDTPINQILKGIALITSIGENFNRGKSPFSLAKLAYVNALSVNQCLDYLGKFTNKGILYMSPDKKRILPLKDFHTVSAKTVLEALIGTAEQPAEIVEMFLAAGYTSIEKITINDLVQR